MWLELKAQDRFKHAALEFQLAGLSRGQARLCATSALNANAKKERLNCWVAVQELNFTQAVGALDHVGVASP